MDGAETQTGILVESEDDTSSDGELRSSTGALLESAATDGSLTLGNTATVLTVYTNASCSYCHDFLTQMLPALTDEFVAQGKLSVRFVTVPLKKYPNSALEAGAVYCAAREGKGLAMMEALHALPTHDRKKLLSAAAALKASSAFPACLDSAEGKAAITAGEKSSITLLPTFVLNGKSITGLPMPADLRGWIRQETR